jgi:hypothetical protein
MEDLIKALTILLKYLDDPNAQSPLNCEHDTLWIMEVSPDDVSDEDHAELLALGFFPSDDAFMSFRFGSA